MPAVPLRRGPPEAVYLGKYRVEFLKKIDFTTFADLEARGR